MSNLHLNFDEYNRGNKYLEKKKYDKAIACYKKQIATNECKEAYLNLGTAYRFLGKLQLAEWAYLKSLDNSVLNSDGSNAEYAAAHNNLGLLKYAQKKNMEAVLHYKKALELDPEYYDAYWNLSLVSLRLFIDGDKSIDECDAWGMYETRFLKPTPVPVDKGIPTWDVKSRPKSIVVLAEQGFGDKIMFGRYLPLLKQFFEKIYVQCPPELNCIYEPEYETTVNAFAVGAEVSIPICTLPAIFGLHTAEPEWLKYKFPRQKTDKRTVMVEWSGNSNHGNDMNRSVPVGYFTNLRGINMINCSPDPRSVRGITCFQHLDWLDTIKKLQTVDLVITVDTALVHMAASMGIPCWLLEPLNDGDFRWGTHSTTSAIYPSVEIIRNPGNWEKVFEQVQERLNAKNF